VKGDWWRRGAESEGRCIPRIRLQQMSTPRIAYRSDVGIDATPRDPARVRHTRRGKTPRLCHGLAGLNVLNTRWAPGVASI